MNRLALAALFLAAPLALAKAPVLPQLPPCMPLNELRLTNVIKGSPQIRYLNIFSARKHLAMKRKARSLVEKLPAAAAPPAATMKKPAKAQAAVKKKHKRVQVCKRRNTKRCTWWIWVTK